ncbi:4-diphosphocytidyl-2-C-methyl-D-erythritol kinase [Pontimonas salivibrio]|uniref:4-diphosphocytidyl-2-C-methyl-D-erythritol kinase n=1 Tax=Pontimonas salivibrio TaxID=1159327 RepID=A0A2L2BPE9_9MICO|nr:4-(cytidine 5'-diphospho)-2-C-methyl-D-erythritol kinase [Pontimonas salivibrio]AVG23492.1 4-diphosphocytidyl-2-C-methyl-D-erythritol kinase [Pontimonas salivibrio]
MSPAHPRSVVAQAPGKINLGLWVGPADDTGFHPLLTAFQAVDLWEIVTLTEAPSLGISCAGSVDCSGVPLGPGNIAWKAVERVASARGESGSTSMSIAIEKNVPVAGGMAGGSADAAATLLALQQFSQPPLDYSQIVAIAAELGSDVPFSLQGGSAIGRGRGVDLTAVLPQQPLHLVVVPATFELSTAEVYRQFDGEGRSAPLATELPEGFLDAWLAGDATRLAPLLHNDLEAPACRLQPQLVTTLHDVHAAGALRAMVSGSGPTVLGFANDAEHAQTIAQQLGRRGYSPIVTQTVIHPNEQSPQQTTDTV